MALSLTAMAGRQARLSGPMALAAALAAVLLAGWHAVVLWREAAPDGPPASPPVQTPASPFPRAALDERAASLFGRATATPTPSEQAPLPKAQVPFRLYGVVVPAEGEPLALVGAPGRPTRLVRPGDRIEGRLRVEAIRPDAVILWRDGRRERLALPRSRPAASRAGPPHGGQVRLAPEREGTRFVGLRVLALPPAVGARTGLRPGDVITKVDGMPLQAPEEAPLVAEALRLPRPPTLEVLRAGVPLELGGTSLANKRQPPETSQ